VAGAGFRPRSRLEVGSQESSFVNPLSRGAEAYRQTEARSRSPLELVVMLYDGALRFVAEAIEADASGQLARRGKAISKALAIIGELQSTLNVKEGGDVAVELDRLYSYVQTRLLDVTMKKDPKALVEVQKLMTPLRDAWTQIANSPAGVLAAR
jgi:flagellar protein FliS